MSAITQGSLLWQPTQSDIENANLTAYMRWLADSRQLAFADYSDLWRWSVTDVAGFWASLWDYFGIVHSVPPSATLPDPSLPGARWFPDARLNYAENIFARMTTTQPAFICQEEHEHQTEMWRDGIYNTVNRLAQLLRDLGVEKGDRVVSYMPHIPETVIALLATASIGAIWSSCSPDFGAQSVLDRFQQIEPKVLFAVDGYNYNGTTYKRHEALHDLQVGLPTLVHTILVPHMHDNLYGFANTVTWREALANVTPPDELQFEQLPFDHPLWVLYSSGTTGLPKPIVHGHGGILLEHLKSLTFHNDLKPDDRFFWYTSTGWMMWNYMVGALLTGASIVIYNGSPAHPDMLRLWRLMEETGATYMGLGAAFIHACMKAGIRPNTEYDLSKLRGIGSTGSPLSVAGFNWIYENVNERLALESLSGGTDLCTAFVGGCRIRPIYAGEIQGASLGAGVYAYDDTGQPVVGEVGELVITTPMPSMPLYFWNDPGNQRYISSYFEMYPGIWRHGDWIKFTERGSCIIYGRSDATINRQGVRMGTSELYRVVQAHDSVVDSLVIDLEFLGHESQLLLFVVLRPGVVLDATLQRELKQALRTQVSPRHVPNAIYAVADIPYTLSGKKMELPVRRILLGHPLEKAVNPGAMRNPETLAYFIELAQQFATSDDG